MKEMDALLLRFLDRDYGGASPARREAFTALLQSEDDVLWRWLSGRDPGPTPELRDVIAAIHAGAAA